jgi:hypothetical protein
MTYKTYAEWKASFLERCRKDHNYINLDNYEECWNAAVASKGVNKESLLLAIGEFSAICMRDNPKWVFPSEEAIRIAEKYSGDGENEHKHEHSLFLRCLNCNIWGTPMPGDTECGNCGSFETVQYFPKCCLNPTHKFTSETRDDGT